MTLTKSQLINQHKAALGETAEKFNAADDADFERHLDRALAAYSRIRRLTRVTSLQLENDVADYEAPDDMLMPKVSNWGQGVYQPWEPGYSPLPRMTGYQEDGKRMLNLHPAPSAGQIACFGGKYSFYYLALHKVSDSEQESTVPESDRDIFALLMLIEAVTDLAASNLSAPVSLSRSMGTVNSNSTPAALLDTLHKKLERLT